MKLIFMGMLVCASVFLHSQNCDSTTFASPGTFEVRRILSKIESSESFLRPLSAEELCLIESRRHPSRVVIIILDEFTEVKIFPKKSKQN